MTQPRRRLAATAGAALLSLGLLAGCGSDDDVSKAVDKATHGKVQIDKDGKRVTVEGENGSFSLGDAKLPETFPADDVPLPDDGSLRAVVSGVNDSNKKYFSITYTIDNGNLKSTAKTYQQTLRDAGYEIQSSSETAVDRASFAAFTAVGPKWDVIVYSGATGGTDNAALSIQVTPHQTSKDGSSSTP